MAKKINFLLEALMKLITPLLMVILTTLFTIKGDISAALETNKNIKEAFEKHEVQYYSLTRKADLMLNKQAIFETRQTHLINEVVDVRLDNSEFRNEQQARTSAIKCINKIKDTIGCNIPKEHEVFYK